MTIGWYYIVIFLSATDLLLISIAGNEISCCQSPWICLPPDGKYPQRDQNWVIKNHTELEIVELQLGPVDILTVDNYAVGLDKNQIILSQRFTTSYSGPIPYQYIRDVNGKLVVSFHFGGLSASHKLLIRYRPRGLWSQVDSYRFSANSESCGHIVGMAQPGTSHSPSMEPSANFSYSHVYMIPLSASFMSTSMTWFYFVDMDVGAPQNYVEIYTGNIIYPGQFDFQGRYESSYLDRYTWVFGGNVIVLISHDAAVPFHTKYGYPHITYAFIDKERHSVMLSNLDLVEERYTITEGTSMAVYFLNKPVGFKPWLLFDDTQFTGHINISDMWCPLPGQHQLIAFNGSTMLWDDQKEVFPNGRLMYLVLKAENVESVSFYYKRVVADYTANDSFVCNGSGLITADSGILYSGSSYINGNTSCRTMISVDFNSQIAMSLTSFDSQGELTIYAGSAESSESMVFRTSDTCNGVNTLPVICSHNALTVYNDNDSPDAEYIGFKLAWQAQKPAAGVGIACGSSISFKNESTFTSENWPCLPRRSTCVWRFVVRDYYLIQFNLTSSYLQSQKGAMIFLYSGERATGDLLNVYTSSTNTAPATSVSCSNIITLVYDVHNATYAVGGGIKGNLKTLDTPTESSSVCCYNYHYLQPDFAQDTSITLSEESTSGCLYRFDTSAAYIQLILWQVNATAGDSIAVVAVCTPEHCGFNRKVIWQYNASSEQHDLIVLPVPSQTLLLSYKKRSSLSVNGSAVAAQDCSQTKYLGNNEDWTFLYSPNYPFHVGVPCSYIVSVPTGKAVKLTVNDVDLSENDRVILCNRQLTFDDCSDDNIIKRMFAGEAMVKGMVFKSDHEQMFISFRSKPGSGLRGRGFKFVMSVTSQGLRLSPSVISMIVFGIIIIFGMSCIMLTIFLKRRQIRQMEQSQTVHRCPSQRTQVSSRDSGNRMGIETNNDREILSPSDILSMPLPCSVDSLPSYDKALNMPSHPPSSSTSPPPPFQEGALEPTTSASIPVHL